MGAGRKYNRGMALPTAIYSTRQVRELDAHAIEQQGVAGYQAGQIPPYPFRISATSAAGEPSASQVR